MIQAHWFSSTRPIRSSLIPKNRILEVSASPTNQVHYVATLGKHTYGSFYGSTRTYHSVLALHGLEELGQKLHALSVQGKWNEMREAVTTDHILELADVCTYDGYPTFLRERKVHSRRTSFSMARNTPEQEERFQHLLKEIQGVQNSEVTNGLEF